MTSLTSLLPFHPHIRSTATITLTLTDILAASANERWYQLSISGSNMAVWRSSDVIKNWDPGMQVTRDFVAEAVQTVKERTLAAPFSSYSDQSCQYVSYVLLPKKNSSSSFLVPHHASILLRGIDPFTISVTRAFHLAYRIEFGELYSWVPK